MKQKKNRCFAKSIFALNNNSKGVALLLVIFAITLVSILVIDFTDQVESFQRSCREYTEGVQARYLLKTSMSIGKLVLEAPDFNGFDLEDYFGEYWYAIGSVPELPIEGVNAKVTLQIVDEDGKIDINWIKANSAIPSSSVGDPTTASLDKSVFWQNALVQLFKNNGLGQQKYKKDSFQTLGDSSFDPDSQVAVIADWIDKDSESFQSSALPGTGIESSTDKSWFFNRPLKHISELANVPGMTLERIQRIAPYIKTSLVSSSANTAININTADAIVLKAIGIDDGDIDSIVNSRQLTPKQSQDISTITAGRPELQGKLKVNSSEFSAVAKVEMPTKTYWLRVIFGTQNGIGNKKPVVRSYEFY